MQGPKELARIVGIGRAKRIDISSDMIDAEKAYEIGLVNRVVPAEDLMEEAMDMAERIGFNGQIGSKVCKDSYK